MPTEKLTDAEYASILKHIDSVSFDALIRGVTKANTALQGLEKTAKK